MAWGERQSGAEPLTVLRLLIAEMADTIKEETVIVFDVNYPINILQKLTLNHDELRTHPASMELQYQSVKDNLVTVNSK